MPKKRNSTPFSKPSSPVHPSLAAKEDKGASSAETGGKRGVNERLQKLRLEQNGTGSPGQVFEAPPAHTVHPSVREILQVPDTPPPRPRPGLRVLGHRRVPPGPRAPDSWLVQREREKRKLRNHEPKVRSVVSLPGFAVPEPGSLLQLALSELARNWDFFVEYEQFYLPSIPIQCKELLIQCIASNNPQSLDRRSLEVLFQSSAEVDGATGADDLKRLDLSNAIGHSLQIKDLKQLATASAPFGGSAAPKESDKGDVPEDWDSTFDPSSSLTDLPRFHALTRLSLASPGLGVTWSSLLSLLPSIPTLTHLSLAHWPTPTLSPNSQTAYISSPSGPVSYGASHYYSAYDDDWHDAASVMRRLSKVTLCLQWLDLTGCWPWIKCLGYGTIDWTGEWAGLETVSVTQAWIPDAYKDTSSSLDDAATAAPGRGSSSKASSSPAVSEWLHNEREAIRIEKLIRSQIADVARRASTTPHDQHGSDPQTSILTKRLGVGVDEDDDWGPPPPPSRRTLTTMGGSGTLTMWKKERAGGRADGTGNVNVRRGTVTFLRR